MQNDALNVVELTSTKPPSSRSRSIRKRKFTAEEYEKATATAAMAKVEADQEGPFWFEKSSVVTVDGEKGHRGITRRERQLLTEIVKSGFFTPERLRDVVVPLNDETSTTPRLRAFDWAVTNFAKGRPQLSVVNGQIVDPNLDYQTELKKHHRLLFDPFRRGTHLFFEVDDGVVHRTTVGQLSFMKWCFEHKVDNYVEANLQEIKAHMSATTRARGCAKRRKELTKAPRKLLRGAVFGSMRVIGSGGDETKAECGSVE